jgi:alpha-L-arabinofuranosidase
MRRFLALVILCSLPLSALASTTITVESTPVVTGVNRFGMNLGFHRYWDAVLLKNLAWRNVGFEPLLFQSMIRCATITASGCVDDNPFTQWPNGFWNGATVDFVLGTARGATGTVTSFLTAPRDGVTGSAFTFSGLAVTPAAGDYFVVRRSIPGGAQQGWTANAIGGATIESETADLPPNTDGLQCIRLSAPSMGQMATISTPFGSFAGQTFVIMNGTYRVSFKAKRIAGTTPMNVAVTRGTTPLVSRAVTPSSSWETYDVDFSAAEPPAASGFVTLMLGVAGSTVLIDDVSLTQTNGDPTNTTAFRDPVVAALRTFNPGIIRMQNNEHADTLDLMVGPPFGRRPTAYTTYGTVAAPVQYGLHESLELAEAVGAQPWFTIPLTFSDTDTANLVEYLSGPTTTPYGAKRAARGHPAPWTDVFSRIHMEFGNETWNPTFRGETMLPADYGRRGSDVFGIIRQSPYYNPKMNLILGVQAAGVFNMRLTHNASANHDTITIGPYMAGLVNDFESNERLFGGLFAEGSWWSTPGGFVGQMHDFLRTHAHPAELSVYEVNLHTTQGAITQPVLDSFTPSIGAGLGVANHMLVMLRDRSVRDQVLFSLVGYRADREDGKTALLWATTRDIGITDRKRPQYLAVKLVNEAMSGDLVRTTQSGDNPTWNQPLTNRIQLDNIPYVQTFAFANGSSQGIVIFNLHRTSSLDVDFAGPRAPRGTVTMRRMSAAAITDTNENAENVVVQTTTLSSFDPAQPLTLPPFSLTVLLSTSRRRIARPGNPAAVALSATEVSVSWTASEGATSYEVARMSGGGALLTIATVSDLSYSDHGVSAGHAYVYRVRALGDGDPSEYSDPALATTVTFSDDPLMAGATIVRASHLTEIREAVNAVRATAAATLQSWTDSPVMTGSTLIRAAHILELRTSLTGAFALLDLQPPSFANSIEAGSVIRAADLQELRNAVR